MGLFKLNELAFAKNGIGAGMTAEDVAKKHGVTVESIEDQIEKGVKIELEHTSDLDEARDIAIDHLVEFPDYYDRLKEMEDAAKAEETKLAEEFKRFLISEMTEMDRMYISVLNESEILSEGKIMDWIRWKLAKFSLRFLSEKSTEELLMAYYSDSKGNPTEKSRAVATMSKKEKLNKIREISEKLPKEAKEKILNSTPAKQLEKKAMMDVGLAAVAGIGAGLAGAGSSTVTGAAGKLGEYKGGWQTTLDAGIGSSDGYIPPANEYRPWDIGYKDASIDLSKGTFSPAEYTITTSEKFMGAIRGAFSVLSALASILFGAMWGAIILAGVNTAMGLRKVSQAATIRRDEIANQIRSTKGITEGFKVKFGNKK
jgi:hypothetical protein